MPPGENETLTVTDHRMTVPAPLNTVRFGTPNACNQAGCHADRTPDWASRQAERWYGTYQAPYVQRAEAISRGRAGDPAAAGPLTRLLTDSRQGPFLRAAAASLLGRIGATHGPDALTSPLRDTLSIFNLQSSIFNPSDALLAALRDPHPSIRARAATALGQAGALRALRPLRDALRDPVAAVRIRASFSLTALGYLPSPPDTAAHRAFAEHEAWVNGIMADNPTARVTLGQAYEGRKDFRSALREYRIALRLNPDEAGAKTRAEAVEEEIEKHRRATAMLSAGPAGGRTHAALGIIAEKWGDYGKAAEHLTEALRRGMGAEAVLVSLGDACRGLGRQEDAIRAYRQALALAPLSPGALRGLALIAYAEGRDEEGRRYEERYRQETINTKR
jgi:tetratricopeptide (TPR) repeat protein